MLTKAAKKLLRRVMDGEALWGVRVYPHAWTWRMDTPDEVGLDTIPEGQVADLVMAGAGHIKPLPTEGRTERAQFVASRNVAEALLAERALPDDPLQLNMIPKDHKALAKRPKPRAKGAK